MAAGLAVVGHPARMHSPAILYTHTGGTRDTLSPARSREGGAAPCGDGRRV